MLLDNWLVSMSQHDVGGSYDIRIPSSPASLRGGADGAVAGHHWLHSLLWHVSGRKWFFTVLHVARNAPLSTPGDRYQQQYL